MLTVFRAICDLLEFDHGIESDKRKTFQDLGIIYQVLYVEYSIPPRRPERKPVAEIDRLVVSLHHYRSELSYPLPGFAAEDHIQIADGVDQAAHCDRPASEHRVLTRCQLEGAQSVEEKVGRVLDLRLPMVTPPLHRAHCRA